MKDAATRIKCKSCNTTKHADDFPPRKSSPAGRRNQCRTCTGIAHKAWRESHPEALQEQRRKSYFRNREGILAKQRLGNAADPEKVKSIKKRWDVANKDRKAAASQLWGKKNRDRRRRKEAERKLADPEKYRAKRKSYYERNKSDCLNRQKKWAAQNPEAARAIVRNYRALKKTAGKHTGAQIQELYGKQHGRCICCNERLDDGYHVDHYIPISKGGSNGIRNLQLLCPPCNLKKHNKDPLAFMQELGFLL